LNVPDRYMGDGELINADGFTSLYNFSTAGLGPGGLQGYLKGKFATAATPNARLNGYMRFVTSSAQNTRSAFYAGDTITRTYDIAMPGSPFVIGYAVDAGWVAPTVTPVTDPMADFPPEANCAEPYGLVVTQEYGNLTDTGGEIKLKLEVYDHQGFDTYQAPTIECPELFDPGDPVIYNYPDHCDIYFNNTKHAPPGLYKILISVEDDENSSSPDWIDLVAYTVYTVTVEDDSGWAVTWGGDEWDITSCVVVDEEASIYVGGYFSSTVDFDPGPGEDIHTAVGTSFDAFISKFDQYGNHMWTRTFGGPGRDLILDMSNNYSYNNLEIVGSFEGTVDFDPGPGVFELTSAGGSDAFYVTYESDGEFYQYGTYKFGGPGDDAAVAIDRTYSRLVIAGTFEDTCSFSIFGSGTSNGGKDVFVAGSLDDEHNNSVTFGGTKDETVTDASFAAGLALITGNFQDTVDFGTYDPQIHSSNGSTDCYLASFYIEDIYIECTWSRTWGGPDPDSASAVIAGNGSSYVTGSFRGTADFNGGPGGLPDEKTSNGQSDIFLSKYDGSSGEYADTVTFGSDDWDNGNDIRLDHDGNIYLGGRFSSSLFSLTSNGDYDALIVKFDSNLSPVSFVSWGGPESDSCSGLAIDDYGRFFVVGGFDDTVDFNPGSGVDNHTSNGGPVDAYLMKLLPTLGW
jgi:hypothetical protein